MCACCGLLCLTLCDPMDCSLPGSSVHGEFSGNNNQSGLPCPPPGDLPNQGIKPLAIMFPALAGSFFATSTTWEALGHIILDDDYVVSFSIFITSLATRELRLKTFPH